jgi:hypothetical protein
MKRWRDLLLIVVLFGILIAFTIYGPGSNQPDEWGQPGSTYSSGDEGALGLQRWLQELGYNAQRFEFTPWDLPDSAAALFVIAPDEEPFTDEQAAETLRWVRDGGTLILVEPFPPGVLNENKLLEQLGADVFTDDDATPRPRAEAVQPLLTTPPVASVPVNTTSALELDRDDYVPLLRTPLGDSLVGVQEGDGYVYLAAVDYPFSNGGLREPGSAALILNLLRRVPPGATILFDEFHHGYNTPPTVRRIAFQQGWGWAVIYTIAIVTLYIVLTGRRFGRAVPLRADVQRRSSAEYVQSLATLLRRAGKGGYVAGHYRTELKRRLARPWGFVPPDDDAAFVRELQRVGGATDDQAARLLDLLGRFDRVRSEDGLVQLVQQTDALADERGRLR